MKELLGRFVAAFQRGIEGEVAAMRASAEAFEISLTQGVDLGGLRYGFEAASEAERLVTGNVGVLRAPTGDQPCGGARWASVHVRVRAVSRLTVGAFARSRGTRHASDARRAVSQPPAQARRS